MENNILLPNKDICKSCCQAKLPRLIFVSVQCTLLGSKVTQLPKKNNILFIFMNTRLLIVIVMSSIGVLNNHHHHQSNVNTVYKSTAKTESSMKKAWEKCIEAEEVNRMFSKLLVEGWGLIV